MPGLHIDEVGGELNEHYGDPVKDFTGLANINTSRIPDGQRRFVSSQNADFFYEANAVEGDVIPNDQLNGTGFWIKDKLERDNELKVIQIPLSEVNLTESSTDQEVYNEVSAWITANGLDKLDIDTFAWEIFEATIQVDYMEANYVEDDYVE